jgi:phosphonate transport system substrate-binding protein
LTASAVAFLSFSGCKGCKGSNGNPAVLHYAFAPNAEQLQSSSVRTDLLMKYLSSQLHMPVEVVRVEGYGPTIEAMRTEKVDIATFGSLGYIVASQKAGAEAIIARGDVDGKLGSYYSVISVPKNSPYRSLADLKAHAKDIVFAFADPASTSGNLYPRIGLLDAGINPEKDFKKVVFAGSHLASCMTLKESKVDAAAYQQSTANRMIQMKRMAPDDIREIWKSEPIPNGPTAVRKNLPEKLKKDIQDALLNIQTRDPAYWASLTSSYRLQSSGMKNIAVSDATYDGLRKYASQVKDFDFVEK